MAHQPAAGTHPVMASVLHGAGEITASTQRAVNAGLGRARLQLKLWELRADPRTREWLAETKQGIADGTVQAAIDAQPDLREYVADRRK